MANSSIQAAIEMHESIKKLEKRVNEVFERDFQPHIPKTFCVVSNGMVEAFMNFRVKAFTEGLKGEFNKDRFGISKQILEVVAERNTDIMTQSGYYMSVTGQNSNFSDDFRNIVMFPIRTPVYGTWAKDELFAKLKQNNKFDEYVYSQSILELLYKNLDEVYKSENPLTFFDNKIPGNIFPLSSSKLSTRGFRLLNEREATRSLLNSLNKIFDPEPISFNIGSMSIPIQSPPTNNQPIATATTATTTSKLSPVTLKTCFDTGVLEGFNAQLYEKKSGETKRLMNSFKNLCEHVENVLINIIAIKNREGINETCKKNLDNLEGDILKYRDHLTIEYMAAVSSSN